MIFATATGRVPLPHWVTYVLLAAAVVHAILCVGFYRWYRHTGVGRFFLSRRHVHVRQSAAIAWSIALVSICLIAAVDANEWPLLGVVRASFAASFALALALGIRDVRRIEVARPAMVRRIREDAEREHWLTSVWWWRIGLVCAAAAPFAKKTTPFPFLLMMPLALKLMYTLLDWLSRILFGHRFVPLMRGMNPLSVRGSDWILSLVLWTASVGLVFGLDRLSTSWLGVPLLLETVSTR